MTETNGKKASLKEDELIEKFLQLRKEGLSKGLTNDEISQAFKQNKPWTWKGLMSNSVFQSQMLLVLTAVVIATKFGVKDVLEGYVYDSKCLISNNPLFSEMARPLADCNICKGLTSVPVERAISTERFVEKYAYSKVPVLIKEGTSNWTAMDTFSFHFFKELYTGTKGALLSVEEECQFFPYKTEFETLAEAFNMSDERAALQEGEAPWYFGWSNCHREVAAKLRSHYQRPYFLPNDSESSTLDWIFMGGPGVGAFIHLDSVMRPSWQAQISGAKTWQLIPSPECESVCHSMNVTVNKGDIIVVDTNEWYHSTFIHPGELSITIGSEYD
ncbi:bifunctional arginine demethylase and lysyl-hydroxylase PSR-like [Haliotis asinina]|uniref:bifunctional arginine demethylase and lysyl-hydroxylase PSR-like n=1 Tax=Haliotis asinina TaxID=109174 RepID=UPI00353217A1